MKTSIISTVILLACIFTISAQEINPIRMGQYFEQGYGRAPDNWSNEESALDIIATPTGIAMAGWMSTESHGLRMALWHVNQYGALSLFGEYGNDQTHQIAASLALSSTGQSLLVGRQTDTYSDEYRSTLNTGDLALIKYIDTDGGELWSVLLDSTDTDTSEVAVDVFNAGNNEFVILINRLYSENNNQDFRVIKIESNSNVLWDKKYSFTYSGSKQNVFAEKIIDRGNGYYLVQANDVYNKHVLICEINANDGSYQAHQNYPQTNPTLGFDVSQNLSTGGYIVVGSEENGPELDGFVLEINPDLSEYGSHTIVNGSSGNEHFKDIITHPTGYLAIGECDNRGEGQRDVWICHLDSLADTLKVETLGGEETDFGHSAVLVPSVFSVFIAGYNNSYTIEESGNAYLGGVKVDMGLPESGECEIPRILEVEMLAGRDNNSGLIYPKILDPSNSSLGVALINYAKSNNITQIALFKLGFIFDERNIQHLYIRQDKQLYKNLLDTFMQNCAVNGIHCGYVADKNFYAIDSAANHNIQKFTYNQTGKFHFVKLEHEYWNAMDPDAGIIPLDKDPSKPPNFISDPMIDIDNYYQEVHQDHLILLNRLKTKKYNNANLWEVYDYIAKLYCELPPPSTGVTLADTTKTSYNFHNQGAVKAKAQDLDGKSDAIMLVHYQSYHANGGVDFLDTSSTNFSVDQWRKRLSYFGNNSSKKTVVIPLFSVEDSADCGQSIETKFLGHVLEGAPYYGSKHLNNVEGAYNLQHKDIYNSSNSIYSQVQNIKLGAYAWFKYDCIKTKSFSVVKRHLCDTLGFAYDPLIIQEHPLLGNELLIYPNPNTGSFQVLSKNQNIKNVRIFDSVGMLVTTVSVENSTDAVVELNTKQGLYFVAIELETGESKVSKIVVQ